MIKTMLIINYCHAIVTIIRFVYCLYVTRANRVNANNIEEDFPDSKVLSIQQFAEILVNKAHLRTEELFTDVIFDTSLQTVESAKETVEVFYVAFQIALCNFRSQSLMTAALRKIALQYNAPSENESSIHTFSRTDSMISSVKIAAISSNSSVALINTLRPNIGDNIYNNLAERKDVAQAMSQWIEDARKFVVLPIEGETA